MSTNISDVSVRSSLGCKKGFKEKRLLTKRAVKHETSRLSSNAVMVSMMLTSLFASFDPMWPTSSSSAKLSIETCSRLTTPEPCKVTRIVQPLGKSRQNRGLALWPCSRVYRLAPRSIPRMSCNCAITAWYVWHWMTVKSAQRCAKVRYVSEYRICQFALRPLPAPTTHGRGNMRISYAIIHVLCFICRHLILSYCIYNINV